MPTIDQLRKDLEDDIKHLNNLEKYETNSGFASGFAKREYPDIKLIPLSDGSLVYDVVFGNITFSAVDYDEAVKI